MSFDDKIVEFENGKDSLFVYPRYLVDYKNVVFLSFVINFFSEQVNI